MTADEVEEVNDLMNDLDDEDLEEVVSYGNSLIEARESDSE